MLAAVQAQETAAFVRSRRAAETAEGVPTRQIGRGIPAEIALARRISPHQAQRYCGWATILVSELPETFAALARGETSEWRATLVARETIFLSREHRAVVDGELAPQLQGLGDRKVEAEAKRIGYRLDPEGFVQRSRVAINERRVSVRPAPDSMCRFTGLLPVAQGIAAYAALLREADSLIGVGDPRGRAPQARDLIADTTTAPVWLRRLLRRPGTGELAALETRARLFTANQRRFLRLRDHGVCRTPWCDAPIRHYDHIVPVGAGGNRKIANGQGLCQACNHAKQARGWSFTVQDSEVTIFSPTRHRYTYRSPAPPRPSDSPLEEQVRAWLSGL